MHSFIVKVVTGNDPSDRKRSVWSMDVSITRTAGSRYNCTERKKWIDAREKRVRLDREN